MTPLDGEMAASGVLADCATNTAISRDSSELGKMEAASFPTVHGVSRKARLPHVHVRWLTAGGKPTKFHLIGSGGEGLEFGGFHDERGFHGGPGEARLEMLCGLSVALSGIAAQREVGAIGEVEDLCSACLYAVVVRGAHAILERRSALRESALTRPQLRKGDTGRSSGARP